MKALLTACTAIACAATQVSLYECPHGDAVFVTGPAEACPPPGGSALRAGSRPASARSAGAPGRPRSPAAPAS
jgi:hypothetical protein